MKKKAFHRITIGEITEKAGVNRSTYYRNFSSKEDIIEYIFSRILEDFLEKVRCDNDKTLDKYLEKMFCHYHLYKSTLLLIHNAGLSYLMLNAFNDFFTDACSANSLEEKFAVYYHTGGIFNSFLLWFNSNMAITPEEMTDITLTCLPEDFKPMLL